MKRWLGRLMALLLLITAAAAPAAAENTFDEEEIDIDELLKIEVKTGV